MTNASAAARPGSPSDSVSAVREQSGCIQAHQRRHNPAVKTYLGEERSERKGRVGQQLTVADVIHSVCSLGRQRREDGGQTGTKVCVALEERRDRRWMAGQKQQQCRATEIWQTWSRTLARAGTRRTAGCFDAGEGAKTVDRVSR
jgi:hypothetical protein